MGRLQGKVAFITGAGGGIGRAAVERFAEEGAKVAAADINDDLSREAAESACKMGKANGGEAFAVHCDVSDRNSVTAAIAETVKRYGKLDVLYNNAGGSTMRDGPVTEAPDEEFWRAIKLDLYGTFLCCQVAVPEIIKAGGGSVINTSSINAIKGTPGRDCYTSAKGGVSALTRSMAVYYAPNKIRVNAVAPSITLSPRVKVFLEKNAHSLDKLGASHILGSVMPIEIANMAVFIASDEARMITGQILAVDSGASVV